MQDNKGKLASMVLGLLAGYYLVGKTVPFVGGFISGAAIASAVFLATR